MHRNILFILLFITGSTTNYGQAIQNDAHLQQLKEYKKRADEYCAKNLNRFGLEELRQYDKSLNVLYNVELNDTLQSINTSFEKANAKMQAELNTLKNKKSKFLINSASYESSYNKLLTKATILIIVLLAAFILILAIWKKRLDKQQRETASYQAKLSNVQTLAAEGEQLIARAETHLAIYHSLGGYMKHTQAEVEKINQALPTDNRKETWKDATMYMKKISQLVQTESTKNTVIVEFAKNTEEEKTSSDINLVCLHYFELVKNGFKMEDDLPEIKATTDLEKNLPHIKILPAAIGHLLIHVLTNAMQSVQAKARKNVKGYEPKVALSTRILPRFLQIRVHDNGDGIEDRFLTKIKDAFFTLKHDDSAGLGLYVSNVIMKNHQGELKIESEKNRGTDIYLKFFIN